MRDLAAEIRAYLDAHGPSRCDTIATGIRARYQDVADTLAAGGFQTAATPEGASPRATHWQNAPVASHALPSRSERLYSVLRDGRAHSRQEIFDRVGFMLTNNAASELRCKRGFDVEHRVENGLHVYQLVSLDEPSLRDGGVGSSSETELAAAEVSSSPSVGAPVSLHLFEDAA